MCEMRDDPGIDLVRFGQLIGGTGEVTDLSGVDDRYGELMFVEEVEEFSFVSSRGFDADECDVEVL